MNIDEKTTADIKKRYDRIAGIYDILEGMMERSKYNSWRKLLWSKVEGNDILEIGVGTGKNFPFYPKDINITAIDFSVNMLERARKKAEMKNIEVELLRMDMQDMEFNENTFDTVVGTFVFCSVPDPMQGLEEVKRVVKPEGKVLLLEHVLSANRVIAGLMNLVNPVVVRIMGPNINRKTVENVSRSGLRVENVIDLAFGIFKLIEARKTQLSL